MARALVALFASALAVVRWPAQEQAPAVRVREDPGPSEEDAKLQSQVDALQHTVAEQSADLAKLARIIGSRQDQLEGQVRSITGDVKSLRGRAQEATTVCSSLRTCGECVASPICGWCSVEQACVAGDRHGSLHGECQFYDFANCKSLACSTYPTCTECVADPMCGYCASDAICLEGSEFGPAYNAKCGISGAEWHHQHGSAAQCPAGAALTAAESSTEAVLHAAAPAPSAPPAALTAPAAPAPLPVA